VCDDDIRGLIEKTDRIGISSGSWINNGSVDTGSNSRKCFDGMKSKSVDTFGLNGHSPVHSNADCATSIRQRTVRNIN